MHRLAALTLLLTLAACGAPNPPPGPHADAAGNLRFGALTFRPCSLTAPRVEAVEAQCATLSVPENHAAPAGRRIELAIALVPAQGQAEPDPILLLAGGPGQSALESYPLIQHAFADVLRTRSVLLIDARGTGKSHPLRCEDDAADDAMTDAASDTPATARAAAVRCRDALAKTSDLRFYGTGDHIRDLDLVRAALGVRKLNLIGVSYGTRVAQQFAKRYAQHTRTVTLDSVAPNTLVLGQEHARNLDAALHWQIARCAADAACLRNLGDIGAKLQALRDRLHHGGLAVVRYRDPVTGDWRNDVPTYGHLALLLRLYAYQPQAAAMLPLIVNAASKGHYESLLAQSRMIFDDVSGLIMQGMALSVGCTEDTELVRDPADADTLMGSDFVDFINAQCEVWPKGRRDADFRAPLTGNVPVLAISGELDPVTPPRYGAEVVKSLPNGRHLVLPGQGHGVLGIGCMPKLFAQFVESAQVRALNAGCLGRLKPTPPFAGNYGWEP